MVDDLTGSVGAVGAVLCLVEDPELRARLVTACREAAVVPDVRSEVPALEVWCSAPLVLIDERSATSVGGLPRRAGVVLVVHPPAGGEPTAEVWRLAVAAGAQHVVVLPEAAGWLGDLLVRAGRPRGRCVAVVGARGGAGATSTAVALATTAAAAGTSVLLVDADPLGGGLDLAMGAEELPGPRWHDLHDVRSPVPPGGLGAALPVADGVTVVSHGRDGTGPQPSAVRAVVQAGVDEYDLVVVDLPRAGDDAVAAAAQEADVLLCVCPSELRAAAAAPLVMRRWGAVADLHLLLRGPAPGGLTEKDAAAAVRAGLELLPRSGAQLVLGRVDVLRPEPGLAAALERGEAFAVGARSPLRRWARRWLSEELGAGPARAA